MVEMKGGWKDYLQQVQHNYPDEIQRHECTVRVIGGETFIDWANQFLGRYLTKKHRLIPKMAIKYCVRTPLTSYGHNTLLFVKDLECLCTPVNSFNPSNGRSCKVFGNKSTCYSNIFQLLPHIQTFCYLGFQWVNILKSV
jgi:hypothetical protein